MEKLNLTDIQPTGWLADQLKVQMSGLTGRLYDVWDSVGAYSGWLGGSGESWERAPYYLDGLVPLSYYLHDEEHWKLCMNFISWTLNSQDSSGNFGPDSTKNDQWSRFIMLKVLVQYEEITQDKRVIPFMEHYYDYIDKFLDKHELKSWSKYRVPDLLYAGEWLYSQTKDSRLIDILKKIDSCGFDWCDYLSDFPFVRGTDYYFHWNECTSLIHEKIEEMFPYHETHIVDIAIGQKHPAVRAFLDEQIDYHAISRKGIEDLIKYHGVVSGCINGDEHLAGNDPRRGAELCSVVENMFSLQSLLARFEDPFYGDLLERLAYNALPATITEDFMAHQYDQQANQIAADERERPWFDNGPDANTFGLEPFFGCCTANMHQGWPKFVDSLWYKDGSTLISAVFAPSDVSTHLEDGDVRVNLVTDYPFEGKLTYHMLESPENMIFKVRVPEWCRNYSVRVDGEEYSQYEESGHYLVFQNLGGKALTLEIEYVQEIRTSRWYRNSLSIERGPLVYALDIDEDWKITKTVRGVHDYSVHSHSDWNYAVCENPEIDGIEENPVSERPFSKRKPPVRIYMEARKCANWTESNGNTADIPAQCQFADDQREKISLIPFGCTKLRISEFPTYAKDEHSC